MLYFLLFFYWLNCVNGHVSKILAAGIVVKEEERGKNQRSLYNKGSLWNAGVGNVWNIHRKRVN